MITLSRTIWLRLGANFVSALFLSICAPSIRRAGGFARNFRDFGRPARLAAATEGNRRDHKPGGYRSVRRGISSTKLQGRNRLSNWCFNMSSHASRQAPGEPGSANR